MIVFVRGQTFNWFYWTEQSNSRSHSDSRQDTKSLYFTSRTTLSGSVSNRLLLTNDRHFASFFFLFFQRLSRKGYHIVSFFCAGRLFPASRFHLLLAKGFITVSAWLKPLFPSSPPLVPYLDNRSSLSLSASSG